MVSTTRRPPRPPQAFRLDASASVDEDDLDDGSFEFRWYCENASGGSCLSQAGELLMDLASGVREAVLSIPSGSLPIRKLAKKHANVSAWQMRPVVHAVP